jgi:hypothetical protein
MRPPASASPSGAGRLETSAGPTFRREAKVGVEGLSAGVSPGVAASFGEAVGAASSPAVAPSRRKRAPRRRTRSPTAPREASFAPGRAGRPPKRRGAVGAGFAPSAARRLRGSGIAVSGGGGAQGPRRQGAGRSRPLPPAARPWSRAHRRAELSRLPCRRNCPLAPRAFGGVSVTAGFAAGGAAGVAAAGMVCAAGMRARPTTLTGSMSGKTRPPAGSTRAAWRAGPKNGSPRKLSADGAATKDTGLRPCDAAKSSASAKVSCAAITTSA